MGKILSVKDGILFGNLYSINMMTVYIKCFASLRQQLGMDTAEVPHRPDMTVSDIWQAVSAQPPPANLLCARNLEYVNFQQSVSDGDEIAFFPPVTGG